MGISRCRGAFPIDGREQGRCRRHGRARWGLRDESLEQRVTEQARVAIPALRVEDRELDPAPRRSVAVAGHGHAAPLTNDIPAQADPAAALEVQPQAARLLHGHREAPAEPHRLQDDDQRPGAPRERREPAEPVPDACAADRGITTLREVHDENVHGPRGQERARERERLREVHRCEHHEPLRANAAGDGLHRVERAGEVQPGDDRARGLGLGGESQGDRGLARRAVPAEGDGGRARQPAGPEDRVQRGEPGGHDAAVRVPGRQ